MRFAHRGKKYRWMKIRNHRKLLATNNSFEWNVKTNNFTLIDGGD